MLPQADCDCGCHLWPESHMVACCEHSGELRVNCMECGAEYYHRPDIGTVLVGLCPDCLGKHTTMIAALRRNRSRRG